MGHGIEARAISPLMTDRLPDDLERLGDELSAATARAAKAERRRSRTAATALAAVLAVASGVLSVLPGDGTRRGPAMAAVSTPPEHRPRCDYARTATFAYPRPCARPASIIGQGADPRLITRSR